MNQKVNIPQNSFPITSEILELVEGFDGNELSWLGGYCVGLARGRKDGSDNEKLSGSVSVDESSLSASKVAVKTIVLYGSQTGNAKGIAEALYLNLSQRSVPVEISNLDVFSAKQLAKNQIILLVVSTHGEGEAPDDAIDFLEALQSKRAPSLEGTKHAVLSLGDSSYEYFCQTGKDFDRRLIELGSAVLSPREDCDVDFVQKSEQWIETISKRVSEVSAVNQNQSEQSFENNVSNQTSEQKYSKLLPFTANITSNQRITGRQSTKDVHHLEIDLADSGINYEPGDSLGIWPKNSTPLVEEILQITKLDGSNNVNLDSRQKSLKEALIEDLELTLLTKDFLKGYLELFDTKKTGKQTNDKIAAVKDILENHYSDYVKQNQIVDLLTLAPVSITAQQLVELLKPIKPRMYSISSSLTENPDEVHITVALKKTSKNPIQRSGAASQFLIQDLAEDDKVRIFVEPNNRFKLPEDDKPIIMIGPGTGVAPFRSFLQQRDSTSAKGKNWLFFGNPNFNTDFLYQLEVQKYHKSGLLTQIELAFSRDQKDKRYVQHCLKENAEQVWQWLNDENAYLYVCGDMKRMAKDVEQTLLEIVIDQGSRSESDSKLFLKQLKKENRYQRDVY